MANTGQLGSQDQAAATRAAAVNPQLGGAAAGANQNPGGFTSSIASGLAGGGGPGGNLGSLLLGNVAPQLGQYGYQGAIAGAQMGEAVSQANLTNAEAQSTTGYNLANILLGAEGTGLQSQGLAEQANVAAQQQGTEQAQFGVQMGQYPEASAKATLENKNAVIAQRDAAAIGGTLDTTKSRRDVGTQAQEYGWQQADIFRQQQLAQLGQQSEQQGYAGQQAQIANQQQQLGLAAQAEGLSRDQAEAQLGFGLQQTGVTTAQDLYGFLGQAAAAQGGAAQTYQGAISSGALVGGLPPGFLQPAGG